MDDVRFLNGVRLLLARDYFEAHDELEAVWQPEPAGERREFLQAAIQLAVALEHLKRDNPNGCFALWNKARGRLKKLPDWIEGVGLGPWAQEIQTFLMGEARLSDRVRGQLEGGVAADAVAGHISDLPPLPPPESWPIPPVDDALRARLG